MIKIFRRSLRVWGSVWLLVAMNSVLEFQARGQIKVTWTNLHPVSSLYSYANAASETQQAGQIYVGTKYHAALWSGTVGSLVDLHPATAETSWVNACNGGQQVGFANIAWKGRAALWAGT